MNRRNTRRGPGWSPVCGSPQRPVPCCWELTAVGQIGSSLSAATRSGRWPRKRSRPRWPRHAAAQHRQPAPQPPATQPPAARPAPQAQAGGAGRAGRTVSSAARAGPRVVSEPGPGFRAEDDRDVAAGQVAFDGDDLDVRVALSC
ncbi:hypothetical protein HBB16_16645 [Pseudonocardia sp. MCCB 268]|nr:hypothetical protein [Pseudonocardia cytotoxica]